MNSHMNSRNFLCILGGAAVLGLLALGSTHGFAAVPKAPKTAKATPVPTHSTIATISADSITVTEPKGSKTYKITKDTELDLKGEKVKVDDLKPGMRVSVTVGSDAAVAERISASEAPTDAPPAKGKTAK